MGAQILRQNRLYFSLKKKLFVTTIVSVRKITLGVVQGAGEKGLLIIIDRCYLHAQLLHTQV